ncbi:MAG: gliding motility-associated C-terminal domain-containing protein [Bacteroidales bacterium]|nr:gliding motility-associated C-terminal domain-containing protein [Bacteroidales bacterium]
MNIKSLIKTFVILIFLTGNSAKLFAQIDTEFWFVIPDLSSDHSDDTDASFRFAAVGDDIIVTIAMPKQNKVLATITILAGEIREFSLKNLLSNNGDLDNNILESGLPNYEGIVQNRGIHITSVCANIGNKDNRFSVYLDRYAEGNRDIWTLKGKNSLGTNFTIPGRNIWINATEKYLEVYNGFDIVATQDNTIITIIPSAQLQMAGGSTFPAKQPVKIVLNKGETFSCISIDGAIENHVGGSTIASDKPIAVSYKDDSVNSDDGNGQNGGNDTMGDQLIPDNLAGTEFIVPTGQLDYEMAFITSISNGTTNVVYNGNTYTLQGRGACINIPLADNANYIKSDAAIHVFQGTGSGNQIGGALIPPIICTGSREATVIRTASIYFFINIITKAENINNFLMYIDGVESKLSAALFSPVPGKPDYYFLEQHNFSDPFLDNYGGFTIQENVPIKVINTNSLPTGDGLFHLEVVEGTKYGCKAGFFSNYGLSYVDATIGENYQKSETYCYGDTIILNAIGNGDSFQWSYKSTGSEICNFIDGNKIANPRAVITGPTPIKGEFIVKSKNLCSSEISESLVNVSIFNTKANFYYTFTNPNSDPVEVNVFNTSSDANKYNWLITNSLGETVFNTVKYNKSGFSFTIPRDEIVDGLDLSLEAINDPCFDYLNQKIELEALTEYRFDTLCADADFGFFTKAVNVNYYKEGYWEWGDGSAATTFEANENGNEVIHRYINTGSVNSTYTAKLYYKNYKNETRLLLSTDVVVLQSPSINLGNATACPNEAFQLMAIPANGSGVYVSHQWTDSQNVLQSKNVQQPWINTNIESGVYNVTYTVTDSKGCIAAKTIALTIVTLPEIVLEQDGLFCVSNPEGKIIANITPAPQFGEIYQSGFIVQNGLTAEGVLDFSKFSINTPIPVSYFFTDANGCTTTVYKDVMIIEDIPLDLESPRYICEGADVLNIDAGIFENYQWSTNETSRQISVYYAGTYYVTVSKDNCSGNDTVEVIAIPPTHPSVKLSVDNSCGMQPINARATFFDQGNAPEIQWFINNVPIAASPDTVAILPTKILDNDSEIKIVMRSSAVCPVDSVVQDIIQILPSPKILIDYDNSMCLGELDTNFITISTSNNVGGNSEYSTQNGLFKIHENEYGFLADSLAGITSGEHLMHFSWTGENNCTMDSTISIYVGGAQISEIIGNEKNCINSIQNAYYIQANDVDHVVWHIPDSIKNYTLNNNNNSVIYIDWSKPTIENISAVVYDSYQCKSLVTKKIYVAPPPVSKFNFKVYNDLLRIDFINESTQDSIIANGESILPEMTSFWYFRYPDSDAVIQTAQDYNQIINQYYKYGYYDVQLVVRNDYNCIDSSIQKVFMDVYSNLYVPSALSPNNISTEVREFLPKGIALLKYEVWIYDKWGNLIWYSDKLTAEGSPAEGWDGRYDDQLMQTGSYIWKIDATLVNGKKWKGIADKNGEFKNMGVGLFV